MGKKKTRIWVVESQLKRSEYPGLSERSYEWSPEREVIALRSSARVSAKIKRTRFPSESFRVRSYIREKD
jgi:hypothetical protein